MNYYFRCITWGPYFAKHVSICMLKFYDSNVDGYMEKTCFMYSPKSTNRSVQFALHDSDHTDKLHHFINCRKQLRSRIQLL